MVFGLQESSVSRFKYIPTSLLGHYAYAHTHNTINMHICTHTHTRTCTVHTTIRAFTLLYTHTCLYVFIRTKMSIACGCVCQPLRCLAASGARRQRAERVWASASRPQPHTCIHTETSYRDMPQYMDIPPYRNINVLILGLAVMCPHGEIPNT